MPLGPLAHVCGLHVCVHEPKHVLMCDSAPVCAAEAACVRASVACVCARAQLLLLPLAREEQDGPLVTVKSY